jgi:hypothetical protein
VAVVSQDSRLGVSLNQLHTSKMLMPRKRLKARVSARIAIARIMKCR